MDKPKNGSYFSVFEWMHTKLNLKGNELYLFALIYSFTVNSEQNKFYGSLKYINNYLGISDTTAICCLKSLVKKDYIYKKINSKNGFTTRYDYYVNLNKVHALIGMHQDEEAPT